ncbi:MAG: ABC transporter ATP-binding protein [Phycisphaerales bacterium]|nr:ABC transporter ATP-binding protein [Phycisphaerales bacterium]
MTPPTGPLLQVRDLVVSFPGRTSGEAAFRAVDSVSFEVPRGESLGLVGESGSGKSTVGRAVLGLIRARSGSVGFDGVDVLQLRGEAQRRLRRRMQIVFQDPGGCLNPRMRAGAIVAEPLLIHRIAADAAHARGMARELLVRCGLRPDAADRYPHQFSGGQRQRIAIARAIAAHPEFIVCDEPTSALDVSIQAQIINLLMDLQREFGLSYLFISHDIGLVQHVCGRIAVMTKGKIVEAGPTVDILREPAHPYTRSLLDAVPVAPVAV